jgi:hypothetical protein
MLISIIFGMIISQNPMDKLKDIKFNYSKKNYGFVREVQKDGKTFLLLRGDDPKDEIMVEKGTKKIKKVKIREWLRQTS